MTIMDTALKTDINVGTRVECRDAYAGVVSGFVRAQGSPDISGIIIRRGLPFSKYIRLPISLINRVADRVVLLNINMKELKKLPAYRTDEEIKSDVRGALRGVEQLRALGQVDKMRVEVTDGVVRLQGSMASSSHKWMAEAVTRRVKGVMDVRNEMLSDTEIESDVAVAIGKDPGMHGARIHVRSFNGAVRLRGLEASEQQMAVARSIAAGRPGVKEISSHEML